MASRKSCLLLLFALCSIAATALAQRYTVTDLGPLTPTGINTWAQVVGSSNGHAYFSSRTRVAFETWDCSVAERSVTEQRSMILVG